MGTMHRVWNRNTPVKTVWEGQYNSRLNSKKGNYPGQSTPPPEKNDPIYTLTYTKPTKRQTIKELWHMAIKVSFNLFIWLLLVHFNFLAIKYKYTPLSFLSSSHKLHYIHPHVDKNIAQFPVNIWEKKNTCRVSVTIVFQGDIKRQIVSVFSSMNLSHWLIKGLFKTKWLHNNNRIDGSCIRMCKRLTQKCANNPD